MNNIFENAYFGKVYKTRDGHKAIYIYKETIYPFRHALSLGGVVNAMYKENGLYDMEKEVDNYHADIVSEWEESVDEKELDDMANDFGLTIGDPMNFHQAERINYAIIGFKAGYHKAMEK